MSDFMIELMNYSGYVLLVAAVGIIATAVASYWFERSDISRRLSGLGTEFSPGLEGGSGSALRLDDGKFRQFDNLVGSRDEEELSVLRGRLIRAGFRNPSAVRVFYAARFGLGIGGAVLAALLVALLASRMPTPILMIVVSFVTLAGFLAPSFWIERSIETRREQAQLGFPDILDMMLVCIEAGNGLNQAIYRVGIEVKESNKTLSEEFLNINDEMRAGKGRSEVLRDFADRLKVNDISAFVTILNQSDEYGVSIADSLRVYSSEMRHKRVMRAEEKANVLPVKLALATIVFTVPPVLIILAGPSVIMIIRSFAGLSG